MTFPFDGPPLDPSSPTAQQWLRDEFAHGSYTTQPSWFQRLVEWIANLLGRFGGHGPGGFPAWVAGVVALVFVAVAVLVVSRLVRPEARALSRTRRATAGTMDDEGLSAADYRGRAALALARADWDAVLLDRYRALAASAVERTLLGELPGRTAHEVAVALAPVFPDHRAPLAAAAAAFDAVRYGHERATSRQAHDAAELDDALLRTRPRIAAEVRS
ncbi:DUF4129 domain-containing protein [Nostocoides sp. HKS02]|uniref:DUF4129 domain-containing protein n=1 Tax=Nostocoides sp. HKS02 TaxID=1813880 RepID=UPI0012B4DF9B|nr:DUF4129 domain-containing protein [Tetrasphaera sp. HKS02]QGN56618.1 DUF4129 domain-containing protein [Tetrasphaera sp. HKS02]